MYSVPELISFASCLIIIASLASLYLIQEAAPPAAFDSVDSAVFLFGVWTLFTAIGRALLIQSIAKSQTRRLLSFFPLSAEKLFQHLLSPIRADLFFLFFETLAVYWFAAWVYEATLSTLLLAMLCAVLTCTLSFHLSLILQNIRVSRDVGLAALFLLPILFVCAREGFPEFSSSFIGAALNPAAWPGDFYLNGWLRGDPWAWIWMLLSLTIVATLPFSSKALRKTQLKCPFPKPPALSLAGDGVQPLMKTPPVVDADRARDQLLTEDILETSKWQNYGVFGRIFSVILSKNELIVAKTFFTAPAIWIRRLFGFFVTIGMLWPAYQFTKAGSHIHRLAAAVAVIVLLYLGLLNALRLISLDHCPLRLMPVSDVTKWRAYAKVISLLSASLFLPALLAPHVSPFTLIDVSQKSHLISPLAKIVAFSTCLALFLNRPPQPQKTRPFKHTIANNIIILFIRGQQFLALCLMPLTLIELHNKIKGVHRALPDTFSLICLLIPLSLVCGRFCVASYVDEWRKVGSK